MIWVFKYTNTVTKTYYQAWCFAEMECQIIPKIKSITTYRLHVLFTFKLKIKRKIVILLVN